MKSVKNISEHFAEGFAEDQESRNIDIRRELQESLPLFTGDIFSGTMHCMSVGLDLDEKNGSINHTDSFVIRDLEAKSQKRTSAPGRQNHLACAKRLSRAMRQIPTNSRQHIQAGRLVCHHLVAMLHESPAHGLRVSGKIVS